jgi:hypothetical protein
VRVRVRACACVRGCVDSCVCVCELKTKVRVGGSGALAPPVAPPVPHHPCPSSELLALASAAPPLGADVVDEQICSMN